MDFDRLIAVAASIFGALVAVASLAGWLFDIEILKSLWPQGPALKPNGACALAAGSCSLMLAAIAPRARVVQACFGLAVSAFGCAVLLEYATGADFGFDNLLFRDPDPVLSGRPTVQAAAVFVALGLSLALLTARQVSLLVLRSALAVAVIVATLTGLLSYFISPIDPTAHEALFRYPVPGSLAVFLLGLGAVATNRANRTVSELVSVAAPILGLAAMALLVAVTLFAIDHQRRVHNRAHDAEIVGMALGELLDLLRDAETGQRGYLLTGNEAYLQPYASAAPKLESQIARIRTLIGKTVEADDGMKRIQSLAEGRLDQLRRTIELKRHGDEAAALAIVNADVGKRLMDQLRREISRMQEKYEHDADSLNRVAERILAQLQYTTLTAVSVVAGFGAFLLLDGKRRFAMMRRSQWLLAAANEDLDRRVAQKTKDLAQAKAEAERANLAKSKFLASASHDLRQPVQSLILLLSLVEKQVKADGKTTQTVAMMKGALGGLNSLLTAILDISRLDAGTIDPASEIVSLASMLDRLATEYEPKATVQKLDLRIIKRNLFVSTDPALLERALRNLIENALRYTVTGGVLVGTRLRGCDVRIDVIDTGIGIPAGKQTEIFEEFCQLNNPGRDLGKGLGLGLPIVARVASLLGAKVEVSSRPERGSRFSLTLPLSRDLKAPDRAVEGRASEVHGSILIIEDNEILRRSLEELARDWGYTVSSASNGEEALNLNSLGLRFDAIITDYRLGEGLNGIEAALEIERDADRVLPKLVLTGDTARESLAEISASGFACLHKPVATDVLRKKLEDMLSA
jgi:signal transduction histidine kinase